MGKIMETTNDSIRFNGNAQKIIEPHINELEFLLYDLATISRAGQEYTLNTVVGSITFKIK